MRTTSSSSIETLAASAMASESVSSSHPDWANLLGDVLTLIAKRLSAVDYCSFSAVCTSWASITSPENGMPLPLSLRKNQPYVLFTGDGVGNCEQSEFCTLFDFQDKSFIKINFLPEIRGKWIVGSQFGWLAVIDELANPSLLNPFTRSQIKLPPITNTPEVEPVYDSEGSLTRYSFWNRCCPVKESRAALVMQKIVLSSNPTYGDFDAVAISSRGSLMFLRPGDEKWNPLSRRLRYVVDVIYRDGQFLAINYYGDVFVVDLSCPDPDHSFTVSLLANTYGEHHCFTSYLVDSSGVLLHVLRDQFQEEESGDLACNIVIHSLDPETRRWVPVTSLGDRSLFIGSWCSVSLSAKEVSWLEENRVYFIDDNWDQLPMTQDMVRDIGMYNLTNGSFESCYPPDMKLTWPPPVWIASPQL